MKNLSYEQKVEILREVKRVLDLPEVHSTLSREMKNVTPPNATAEEFEPTGAIAICISSISAPALVWPEDVLTQEATEKKLLDRVRQLPARWARSAELAAAYGAGTTVIEERLSEDLRSFIPELFEE